MKKLILRPISLIILSLAFTIFLLEIFFQSVFPERIIPDLHQAKYNLPTVLRSNVDVTLDWSHGYLYPPFRLQTNSKSFLNDQEFKYEKPENTFRILMLGNSIFMGLGVKNKELFSKNLEDILNKHSINKRVQVINFSGVAWSSIQFFTFMVTEGYKYSPDLVIISQGENDFRVEYNKLIQVDKIRKEILPDNKMKINLEELKIHSQVNNWLSISWEWVRKLPFYLTISKYSQVLHRLRSKVNSIWYNKYPKISNSKQLGYLFEANDINVTEDTIFLLNSEEFFVNPQGHSITFFSKSYDQNPNEAIANIVLHSAIQVKISQYLNDVNSKLMVVDIPAWQETLGTINAYRGRSLKSSLKNYTYLNPTKMFKKFQANNLEIPLYFFNNNHLSPAGYRLMAILAYNFLIKKGLVDFQDSWESIDPNASKVKESIKSANERIENYITTDNQANKFRGLFYLMRGDYNSSKENLIKYLDREKNDFEAHFFLGKALFKLKEFDASLNAFIQSFDGHPLEVKLYKGGWESYEKGELGKALSFAKKLEGLKGEWWPQGLFLNYLIYEKMGRLEDAELYIKQALTLWPNNLKFKLLMSSLKYKQKQFREAIYFGSQTFMEEKTNLEVLLILGVSHAALGNNKEAREFLSRYLQINPKNQFIKKALGTLR